MPRIQLTSIERLDVAHPGLQLDVDMVLDGGGGNEAIQQMLQEKYQLHVPLSTIGSYVQRRYLPRKERWRELIEEKEATLEVIKKHGTDAMAEAAILEQLDEAQRRGERASLKDLLREQRERARLQLDRDRLNADIERIANEKKALELKLSQVERARQKEQGEIQAAMEDGEKDPTRTLERIKEIYNLPA